MTTEPSTRKLVTALMLALGRSAELYDQCRKDGQTETAAFGLATRAHYLLSGFIDEFEDVPEDSRPILAAYETVIKIATAIQTGQYSDWLYFERLSTALAVLGVTE